MMGLAARPLRQPAPHFLSPSLRQDVGLRSSNRRTVSCSGDSLCKQEPQAGPQTPSPSNNGSEPAVSNQSQSLREQLRLLNLESFKRVLKSSLSPRRLEKVEGAPREARSTNRLKGVDSSGLDAWRPRHSSAVREVLDLLKDAEESKEGVVMAMEDWKGNLNSRDIVTLLNTLERWQMAFAVFRWLQSQDSSSLNLFTYNVMLKVLRRGCQWKLAEGIAEDMIRAGVHPDNFTYSTLISCANRCNNQDDALKWFNRMHEAGCIPDEVTYSSMIDVYGRSGRFDEALALYERLRGAGWKPDKITYGTMVNIYGKAGNSKQAVMVFREMKRSGIQPDSVVYNTLISLLGRMGKVHQATKIFEEMEKTGVKPTAFTLSTIIETHSRAGNVEDGLNVFKRLKQEGVICDAAVYNTLIKMCGEGGLVKEGEQFMREMADAGLEPNDWTYKNMLNLYAKQGMVVEAQSTFNCLVEAGYDADVMAYTSLIWACGSAKEYNKLVELFDEMVKSNCKPDERLCGAVLSLLTSCETNEESSLVRECLRKASARLDNLVGQIGEVVFSVDEVQKEFQALLGEVAEEAHKPFCNSLLDLCWNKGLHDRAFEILSILDNLGVYPGLQSKSVLFWALHLRSLSVSAAHCALLSWLSSISVAAREGQELSEKFIIETGAGRLRGSDEPRLNAAIASRLKEMNSPFEESLDRSDWLVASGPDVKSWLETQKIGVYVETTMPQ